ncbi:N-6 DNA methylase [Cyanobacterium stanieri PCC 7202]|uniref:site-specific DNA-methyltransferase (adenine-specific) n=1 Tax=Cyanobacterium stanieri (strain ATCC 29140 / PCC 7202) TaxID=292563 RepID=K9YI21_CYASC|nr:N-6 DNA methylase [Cyanobacterium stanieri PCC 7202]
MITGELKSKVDKLWTTFWNNGVSNPLSVIEQISYLLFIKRLDDLQLAQEKKIKRLQGTLENPTFTPENNHCRWSVFKNQNPSDMLITIRDSAFPFIKTIGKEGGTYAQHMKDAVFLIANPALLANVVEQVDQILESLNQEASQSSDKTYIDLQGDLYEYMLSKLTTAGTNGQFRTPRHIIKMIVELMNPSPQEVICDPACGTGGFLVAVAEYLRQQKDSQGNYILNNPINRQHFNEDMFHGFDFDATMLRIGSMNMMLHGIEDPKIEARDSLAQDHSEVSEAFTLILANPPFKGSLDDNTIAKDLTKVIKTKKTELLFGALFLRLLKKGGRAAVIVPDGVLFGSSKAHKTLRKTLVENHKLDGVISMPSGVFKPYAGVSTAVLIFTKTEVGGTDAVWFYDMEADGLSLDDKRQPVEENDIPDILEKWHGRDIKKDQNRKTKAFFVPKKEIADNGYDLSINRYKQIEYEEVNYETPTVILGNLKQMEREIMADLESLESMVSNK